MSIWMILLLLLLVAIFVVAVCTVIFALLGAQRGQQVQWARSAFTISLGTIVVAAVVYGAAWSIHTLNSISVLDSTQTLGTLATPSTVLNRSDISVRSTAVPVVTPEPGTIIRNTPEPERVTGVNYGADYELTNCNDYVYLTETATVYTGPGTEYDSIGSVTAGATIKRIGYNDEWSLIDYNENYAFVSNSLLIVNE